MQTYPNRNKYLINKKYITLGYFVSSGFPGHYSVLTWSGELRPYVLYMYKDLLLVMGAAQAPGPTVQD